MRKYLILAMLAVLFVGGCGRENDMPAETAECSYEDELYINETESTVMNDDMESEDYYLSSIDYMYAEYDGNIYFRKYNSGNKAEGAILGCYEDSTNKTVRKLMCMDSDGNISEVMDDYGVGSLFICRGTLYSQMYNNSYVTNVYSLNMTDGSETLYESSKIKGYVDNCIVCMGAWRGLYTIDTITGEEKCMSENAYTYIAILDDVIYYAEYDDNDNLYVNGIKLNGDVTNIASFNISDLGYEIDVPIVTCHQIIADNMYIAVGSYGGSVSAFQEGVLIKVSLGGTGYEVIQEVSEKFYITNSNESNVTEDVEVSVPYISDDKNICIIRDANSSEEILLEKAEYENLGYGGMDDNTAESCWEISEIELIDDKLFFTISNGTRDEPNDIGWRTYYVRNSTINCYKNMITGEITIWNEY